MRCCYHGVPSAPVLNDQAAQAAPRMGLPPLIQYLTVWLGALERLAFTIGVSLTLSPDAFSASDETVEDIFVEIFVIIHDFET